MFGILTLNPAFACSLRYIGMSTDPATYHRLHSAQHPSNGLSLSDEPIPLLFGYSNRLPTGIPSLDGDVEVLRYVVAEPIRFNPLI